MARYVRGLRARRPATACKTGRETCPPVRTVEHPGGSLRPDFRMIKILRDIIVSGVEKMAKPDPEIFQLTLRRMGSPDPAEVLFIDDNAVNITAADALGFQTHQFRDAGRLEKALVSAALL
ncbi:MAG: HAD-IA family hydrolase [Henriciella sp.]